MCARRSHPLQTPLLPFGSLHNSDLFSNHWLEHRLPLEPEWTECRRDSDAALSRVTELWRQEGDLLKQYGREAALEQAFIQPMFEALGWKLYYQAPLQGRTPDYALFADDTAKNNALRCGPQTPDFWNHPTVVADAKAWDVRLDRPTRVGNQREYPPEQIEWYLDRSRLPYGILTNGRLWRLIPRQLPPGKPRFQTYLEAHIPRLLDARLGGNGRQLTMEQEQTTAEEFLRFYLFFSPRAFQSVAGRPPLVERALRGSSEYALSVGEDLKTRVFEALRLCIEGFLTHPPNNLDPARDLDECRRQSFVLLYRLLFIMYAEDRGLLPYRRNQLYTANRSLGRHRDEIADTLDRIADGRETHYPPERAGIWTDLVALFDLIDRGHARYDVPAYNGGLFDPDKHEFLARKALPDRYLAPVIDQLGRAPDPLHPERGLFRVDYRDLAIQHLGSIYESLLELRPCFASEPMIVVRRRGPGRTSERTVPADTDLPREWEATGIHYRAGQVYLATDKGERRATGSYYTPDHIVNYIVENTLGPLCTEIGQALSAEIAATEEKWRHARGANREALGAALERLRADYDDRVLKLRVLDPAMGSGHFLVRACQYLAEDIATNPHTADPGADQLNGDESVLTYWKRRVVESCIFGVDLNPMAVELAKLALWLETVSKDAPLSFLDHHLRAGNSLVGARVAELGSLPGAMALQQNLFKQQVEQRLPILLGPLKQIRALPSETRDQIKEKDRLYRRTFQPVCDMFRAVADLWCSTFFALPGEAVAPEQYHGVLGALADGPAFRRLSAQPWFTGALRRGRASDVLAFHWELEFPEVFFDLTGRRAEAGFDAIIGNPPYDVLSERETGRDLSSFKAFIENEPLYGPSRRGKNNLYKLFICRSLDLLAEGGALASEVGPVSLPAQAGTEARATGAGTQACPTRGGGRFGFIVPMALLGDDQAADLRRAMFDAGAFTSVEAFPQKDDPTRRVFPEAKLSTAIFTMVKTASPALRSRPFTARQHPANTIEPGSPSLQLRTDDVPLYDPSNRGIVSCSQADWDLAVRIMGSGRMARLGQFCEFFQGEVNETIQRRAGNLLDRAVRGLERGGRLVTRGAAVCLYLIREASQGEDLHLDVSRFLQDAAPDTKAFHHRHPRVVLQESSPQNNFRRIIAAPLDVDEFCNHTINYCPAHKATISLQLILAILNSKLADWYFRLGSTNAHVSHYQIYNLPCPVFAGARSEADDYLRDVAVAAIETGKFDAAFDLLTPALASPPFPLAVQDVLVELVRRIIAIERARGEIARTERSALAPAAQPLQDLIDRLLYALAGLDPAESAGLEARLAAML